MDEKWIEELAELPEHAAREAFLRNRPELHSAAAVDALQLAVVNCALSDLKAAESLADGATLLAEFTDDEYARAIARRARGHIAYCRSDFRKACEDYESAIAVFERLGHAEDAARTRNGALQTLIYLGRYETALEWAAAAREVLLHAGDPLRAARCDLNAGNIYYRLDRYEEALICYRRSQQQFALAGTPRDQAAACSNLAVCMISMQDFDGALATYAEGRALCQKHGMQMWVAEADYNIAYLHFLRGNYTKAMQLYQAARTYCEQAGDRYHKSLCDLDEAEMLLELNLLREGEELARRAVSGFANLQMEYEHAKAVQFQALAAFRLSRPRRALRLLRQAQRSFQRDGNQVWVACGNLYRAMLCLHEGRTHAIVRAARRALIVFRRYGLLHKAALAKLVLARGALLSGNSAQGTRLCEAVLRQLASDEFAALRFEAQFLLGRFAVMSGDAGAARASFQLAIAVLESIRGAIAGDDLKTAFLNDKLAVYDHFIELLLRDSAAPAEELFHWIERAKSRGLAELIRFRSVGSSSVAALRADLDACYRQWDAAQLSRERSAPKLAAISRKLRESESALAARIAGMQATDSAAPDSTMPVDMSRIRAALPPDAVMIEYFRTNGRWVVCLLTRDQLEVVSLETGDRVDHLMRLLRFQLAKFQLDAAYARTMSGNMLRGIQQHLLDLYLSLVAPVRERLNAAHLVIVPHGPLHHLPFHALWDGKEWLIDNYRITYAPSASVFAFCSEKPPSPHVQALAIGVPDPSTPFVADEIRTVASLLRESKCLIGSEASLEAVRREAAHSRIVHLASHGEFRHDNPMFSSVRLGDARVNLYDLYDMNLDADLVTMSGCSTGLSTVVGGDELLGMVRGILHAGARSVLMSLWDVHDETAKSLMTEFYREWVRTGSQAKGLRTSMMAVRSTHHHPYYWAPFFLIGDSKR